MPDSAPVQGTLMQGKRGLIMGVTNDRSLGWGIANACAAQGAELAFTYQVEALERRVRPLAARRRRGSPVPVRCGRRGQHRHRLRRAARAVGWARFPGPRHRLRGQDLSARPLPRHAAGRLRAGAGYFLLLVRRRRAACGADDATGGSLLTLSYVGAERWTPHYNVMGVAKAALEASVRYLAADLGGAGIRVNAISAGPIRTLASAGIGDFHYILRWNQLNSPMQRNVDDRGCRRRGRLSAVGPVGGRHRRGAPRRLRLPYCRYEEPRRPGYQPSSKVSAR